MVEVAKLVYEVDTSNAVAALEALTKAAERAANAVNAIGSSKDQTVVVNLTGDKWLVDIAGEIIDQIADQSKGGRVVIKRDDQKDE